MRDAVLVALFGGAGCLARYGLSSAVQGASGRSFPLGTLVVNVAGAFLIGLVMELSHRHGWVSPSLRLALVTGFLGGFTTFSAFSYETVRLLQSGEHGAAALNAAGSVAACLASTVAGLAAARHL